MKKKLMFFSALLMCLAFSLSIVAQKGNKPPSGCGADVPLTLNINNGYAIASEALNTNFYVNGGTKRDQIKVGFQVSNCSYDFIVQLNNSTRYMNVSINMPGQPTAIYRAKFANFDRIASVPVTTDPNAMNGYCTSSQSDNYAGCGQDQDGTPYVRRSVGFDLGDGIHNLRFQFSPIDNPNGNPNVTGTSFIKVYHPDPNTWVLIPEGTQTGVFLTNGTPTALVYAPFRFVVTR
jgi:hypothetical protein